MGFFPELKDDTESTDDYSPKILVIPPNGQWHIVEDIEVQERFSEYIYTKEQRSLVDDFLAQSIPGSYIVYNTIVMVIVDKRM